MRITINGINLNQTQIYTSDLFKDKKPIITSTKKNNANLFTTIMVDPDAPYPSNPTAKYFIHLLVVNSNDIKVNYYPPNPPVDSAPHRYQVLLFVQSKYISTNITNPGSNFDLDGFIKSNQLELVDQFEFKVKK
jgi:phosphatidylethanolamine-binding protein (PEBP) family uncharacterized protein